jgi:hypothetical protein
MSEQDGLTVTIDARQVPVRWLAERLADPIWWPGDTLEEDVWQAYLWWLAAEHFGGRGQVGPTRCDSWSSDGASATFEVTIYKPNGHGGPELTVTQVCAIRDEDELTRAVAAVVALSGGWC